MTDDVASGLTSDAGIGERYRWAVESWIHLASGFDDGDWATPVPCTPGWSVRDVLSHVSGIPDDALNGRMDGATTAPWTAAQVERNRDASVAELLARWQEQAPAFAAILDQVGEGRPPFDCHTHEHDVRHALGRPGNRRSPIVEQAGRQLAAIELDDVGVTIEFTDGTVTHSNVDASRQVALRGMTPFEMFRSRVGRRTYDQVRHADWSGDPADVDVVLGRWFIFGPATTPIHE